MWKPGQHDARGQPFKISICLNNVSQQTGCGRTSAKDSQHSRFTGPRIDSQGLSAQNIPGCALHWYVLLYKEPHVGGSEQMFPQHRGASAIDP